MTRTERDAGRLAGVIARLGGGGTRRIAASADLVIERGDGSYLYDSRGTRYLDVVSGFGVASLGHCHPHWVDAVVAQAGRLAVTPLHTDQLARYLTALSAVLPSQLAQIALFSGGAEAVEVAIRLAQTATGRPGVLTFSDGFHGKTLGVRYAGNATPLERRALGPSWLKTAPFPACRRHDAVAYCTCDESAADTLAALARCTDVDDVGAVLVEPLLGTAGNIPPRRLFLSELSALCEARGWLLVLDEMITGFGRTGELFGFHYFGVDPDVLVLGKGLGGGYPLSAVCASSELWDSSSFAEPSSTATSYGSNPIACAAGIATLEVITGDDFLAGVREVARHAAKRLAELADISSRVTWPRGAGLMLGFDLVDPDSGELSTAERCAATFRACRDRGVLVVADVPRVRLSPPLTFTVGEVDTLFDVLCEVLA